MIGLIIDQDEVALLSSVFHISGMINNVSNSTGALTAHRNLLKNQNDLQKANTRLATGKKINSGKDDPAGLIAATKLSAEIEALEAETRSIRRADANANITEGHTSQLSGMMNDLRRLVVESANTGAFSDDEIAANQMQIDSLVSSIQRFGADAVASLDGYNMPDDGNDAVATKIHTAMAEVSTLTSGGVNNLSSGNMAEAEAALDAATTAVSTARGDVGSYQRNTLGPSLRSTETELASLASSLSVIQDTDYAVEVSNQVRAQILSQGSIQALKIANQQGQNVLSLLS